MTVIVMLVVVTTVATIWRYSSFRWRSRTEELRSRVEEARVEFKTPLFLSDELAGLPAPVQRYFNMALTPGQALVAALSIEHVGTFNPGSTGERWVQFTSAQRVVTRRPGFVWSARTGITIRVHDAYIAGEGLVHAALFGLVPVANLRGTRDVAEGELMRFLAEAAWYPTALLPSQGVRWEAVDANAARATLQDGEVLVSLLFRFNETGLIASVRAEARGRVVNKTVIPTPWEGRWWGYQSQGGMRVPTEGEVAWILPQGPKPYWRGRVTKLDYEFA